MSGLFLRLLNERSIVGISLQFVSYTLSKQSEPISLLNIATTRTLQKHIFKEYVVFSCFFKTFFRNANFVFTVHCCYRFLNRVFGSDLLTLSSISLFQWPISSRFHFHGSYLSVFYDGFTVLNNSLLFAMPSLFFFTKTQHMQWSQLKRSVNNVSGKHIYGYCDKVTSRIRQISNLLSFLSRAIDRYLLWKINELILECNNNHISMPKQMSHITYCMARTDTVKHAISFNFFL